MQLFFMLTGIIQFNVLHSNIFRFNSYSLTYFNQAKIFSSYRNKCEYLLVFFKLNSFRFFTLGCNQ